jgi:hypothetical protein
MQISNFIPLNEEKHERTSAVWQKWRFSAPHQSRTCGMVKTTTSCSCKTWCILNPTILFSTENERKGMLYSTWKTLNEN